MPSGSEKSGTDTPEETPVDPAERGGAAWMKVCSDTLSDEEGYQNFQKFVRRFKKKGGENGAPGDVTALAEDLKKCCEGVEDLDTQIEDFLEDTNQGDGWNDLTVLFNNLNQEAQIAFMNTLNRIKWIQDTNSTN